MRHNSKRCLKSILNCGFSTKIRSFSQYLRCVFHLYVDEEVESVKILTDKPMLNKFVTLNLDCCSADRKYWMTPPLFIHAEEEDTFRYRYVVKYKEGLGAWLLKKVTFSSNKDEKTVRETNSRKLNRGINQFDIFHNPSDPNRRGRVFSGQLFFVKQLYEQLGRGGNLKELLIECEHISFGHATYSEEEVRVFLKWVVETTKGNPTPDQSVYTCSLLGQLVHRVPARSASYNCHLLGHNAVDSILLSLSHCTYLALPQTSVKFIKIVAEDLFKTGSLKGCLAFIKYFCNLLDVNYVMQVADKLSSSSYIDQQFDKQVPDVLYSLKRLKNATWCSRYSSFVIHCSPSVPCLWKLYQIMSVNFPSLVHSLGEEYARVYNKFISDSRARKADLLQPLFWGQVPVNLKAKLANPFCKALANQIASETTFSKEKLASLKSICLDGNLQSSDCFHGFILGVMTHKDKELLSIIPDLLNSKEFCSYWKPSISEEEKEKLCRYWLTANFSEVRKPEDKVLRLVEACEVLRMADAMKTNKTLREAMDSEVERLVFKTNLKSVMTAFRDAQSRGPAVQQRLLVLLKAVAKQCIGTGDCRSRFKMMILSLGFDVSKEQQKDVKKVRLDR